MLNLFIDLFKLLLHASLEFNVILYLIFGVCLVCCLSAIFMYLLKGMY